MRKGHDLEKRGIRTVCLSAVIEGYVFVTGRSSICASLVIVEIDKDYFFVVQNKRAILGDTRPALHFTG